MTITQDIILALFAIADFAFGYFLGVEVYRRKVKKVTTLTRPPMLSTPIPKARERSQ